MTLLRQVESHQYCDSFANAADIRHVAERRKHSFELTKKGRHSIAVYPLLPHYQPIGDQPHRNEVRIHNPIHLLQVLSFGCFFGGVEVGEGGGQAGGGVGAVGLDEVVYLFVLEAELF